MKRSFFPLLILCLLLVTQGESQAMSVVQNAPASPTMTSQVQVKKSPQSSKKQKKKPSLIFEGSAEKYDTAPTYEPGLEVLMNDITQNIRYPVSCIKGKISGTVVLRFTVNRKGKIQGVTVANSLHPDADAEAVRAVQSLPGKWKPALKDGKPIDAAFVLPVRFAIR